MRTIVMATVMVLCACSSSSTTEKIAAEPGTGPSVTPGADAGVVGADPNQGGSRLKARVYVGADGSRLVSGMRDTQMNVDCTYQVAADGNTRCLPTSLAFTRLSTTSIDAACKTTLYRAAKGCESETFITSLVVSETACGPARVSVFSHGSKYEAGPLYIGGGAGGGCSLADAAYLDGLKQQYDLYPLGAEIPATTFVATTVELQ